MNRQQLHGLFRSLPWVFAATGVVSFPAMAAAQKATAAKARPNFVFFLVDDLRWDAMSCAGHPFVKTPNVDRLADSGARFTNAFVTIALCAPSRAVFLTGMYSHSNGVWTNEGQEYDHSIPTFASELRKAGYETGFVGKFHMAPTAEPRPGFDYWLSFVGQGIYQDPKLNENGRSFQAQGYMTDILTQHAVEFVKKQRAKPFCLCVWHKAVHGPFTPAERHKDLYADAKMPEPVAFQDNLNGKPDWQKERGQNGVRRRLPANEQRKWNPHPEKTIDYFRTLAAVDDSVGSVMKALQETGALDHTVLIFAGDNGFFHGEHQFGDKRLAYEESIRIPLVFSGPGIKNGTPDQMVLNLDVAPTILDMAGVKPPATMQGRSFKAILAGEKPAWRTSFLYEYFQEAWLARIPTMIGVRTLDSKYVTYPLISDLDELYDLKPDPHEMKNLATDPASAGKLAELKAELDKVKQEARFALTQPAQERPAAARRRAGRTASRAAQE